MEKQSHHLEVDYEQLLQTAWSLTRASGNTEISHLPIATERAEEQKCEPNMTLGEDYKYFEFNNLQRKQQAQVGGIS